MQYALLLSYLGFAKAEVSKSKGVGLQNALDSSLSAKAQNDKVLDSCNDTPLCHTEGVSPKYPKRQLAKQRYLFGYFATLSMTGKITE